MSGSEGGFRRDSRLSEMGSGEIPTSLWMVPYADLMSNMVILFLSLFAYSYVTRTPEYERAVARLENEVAPQKQEEQKRARLEEAQLAVDLKGLLKGLSLDEFGVRVTSKYVHLTLPTPVLFHLGSDRLSPEAAALLNPLARLLARVPNPVLVEGHTDDVPITGGRLRTNWELSAARSFSVIEFFAAQGLAPERFRARGYGEYRPVASNDTPEGRQRNRRIEIRLVRNIETTTAPETAFSAAPTAAAGAAPTSTSASEAKPGFESEQPKPAIDPTASRGVSL